MNSRNSWVILTETGRVDKCSASTLFDGTNSYLYSEEKISVDALSLIHPTLCERDDLEMAPFDSQGGLGKMVQLFETDMDKRNE